MTIVIGSRWSFVCLDILKNAEKIDLFNKTAPSTLSLDYCDLAEIEDIVNRKIYLNDEIDENIVTSAVYHILRYNCLDKDMPVEERKPILLYINSPGGDVISGMSLVSVIESSITPVYTINLALSASMAFLIYICGKKRYSIQYGTFLLHEGYIGSGYESTSKAKDRLSYETTELAEYEKKLVLDHTKISKKMYTDRYRTEWYMTSAQAYKYGVVDYILGENCDINDII